MGSTRRLASSSSFNLMLATQRKRDMYDQNQINPSPGNAMQRPWLRWQHKLGAALAGVALTLALTSAPAQAATIPVDNTTCTLVDAITAANTDTATGGCAAGSGADTIELQSNVTLVTPIPVDFRSAGLPRIGPPLTINGNGFTIARDPSAPAFHVMIVRGFLTLNNTTISGGSASPGAGILNDGGTLILNNSTVSGNQTAGGSSPQGGGIANSGGELILNNSTVSGNSAAAGGGGIVNTGTATLNNSTVSNNSGGGILKFSGSRLTLSNSIVAGQTSGSDCEGGGIITSNGYNLDSDGSCGLMGTGDIPSGMADLGPLQVNAPGNTATHALGANSHAIDAGNCSGGSITTDQRGVARPQGLACDIGSFELEQATNLPPNCAAASASPNTLWPPNHAFHPITINGVTDPDGNAVTLAVTSIFQDEAVNAPGSGNTAPDGQGVGSATAQVRAERVGGSDGRVYTIAFTADDGNGGSCTGTVQVGVPHNKKDTPVDGGALFDATVTP
jgi:hypothetical protein